MYYSASTDMIKRIHNDRWNRFYQNKLFRYRITIIVEEVRPEGGYGVGNQKTHKALMYLASRHQSF